MKEQENHLKAIACKRLLCAAVVAAATTKILLLLFRELQMVNWMCVKYNRAQNSTITLKQIDKYMLIAHEENFFLSLDWTIEPK